MSYWFMQQMKIGLYASANETNKIMHYIYYINNMYPNMYTAWLLW